MAEVELAPASAPASASDPLGFGLGAGQREPVQAEAEADGLKTAQEKWAALVAQDLEEQLFDNPEFASQAGFHQHDGDLQDLSPQAFETRAEVATAKRARVEELLASDEAEADGGLTATQRLHAALLSDALEGEARAIGLGCHLMPLNSVGIGGTVYENLFETFDWMHFDTDDDFQNYLKRLMNFPKQVQTYQDLLAYGVMRKRSVSKAMLRKVDGNMAALLEGDTLERKLRTPLEGKELDAETDENIGLAAKNCVGPAISQLKGFLGEFYAGRAREDPGISAVQGGAEIYAECLRYHCTTPKTAEEVHALGLAEVARLEGRFQRDVLEKLGFEGSFAEFATGLKANTAFFFDSEEALLDGYRGLVSRINAELPRFFAKIPTSELEIVASRCGPAAYYYAGTPDGRRPGRFLVNVTRLDERAKYEMMALALHEGVPGHHLQGSLALENEDLPHFLRYIEDRRYEFCPARRPLYTGYLEGWALYCEALGEEMGMYGTPEELFGRLSMEMVRAVRLVVDTGIHAHGWSIERASAYMVEKTGKAEAECEGECHRYASWPGQACAYKVGELAIWEMRRKAEAALGDAFDLKAFHGLCVDAGPLPLDRLSQRVDEWGAARSG